MTGTRLGGVKARETNLKKHGKDFYRTIGRAGGSKGAKDGVIKGFAANPELAKRAGKIGGTISRRTGVKDGEGKKHHVEEE